MKLYQLQYFIEVARNRNFTGAAKRINLATPALSLQIQTLEDELGTRLFNRGQKATVLTSEDAEVCAQVAEQNQPLCALRETSPSSALREPLLKL